MLLKSEIANLRNNKEVGEKMTNNRKDEEKEVRRNNINWEVGI